MTNWKEYKLGEIGTIARGKSKHRPRDAAFLYGGKYPFIQTGDIKSANHKLFNYSQTYSEDGLKQSKLWPKGTICITIAANIADTAILTFPACFPDSVIGFVANEEMCNIDFIEYLLQYYRIQIKTHSIGSVQDNINLGTFEKIKFRIPDLPTQTTIAEILSSLDDKIELNNKINQELENLAQTLFKQWFIDFEFPVNSLNQDSQDERMNRMNEPQSSKSLNPENQASDNIRTYRSSGGEMVDSELGEIPKGWEVKEIGLVAKLGAGGDKPKNVSDIPTEELNIPIYSNGITNDGLYDYTDKVKVLEESVTISARGTIGFVCLRTNPFVPIVRLISAIADEKYISTKYLYMWLKNQYIYGNGTTQQQLTVPDFKTSKIIIPEHKFVEEFTNQMNDIIENINFNKSENKELTNLRDTLLPKLISGELEVNSQHLDLQD